MNEKLLSEIEEFLSEAGIGEHRFGMLATSNGRLVERLRSGGRIWPDTEAKVRAFIRSERRKRTPTPAPKKGRAMAS